MTAQMVLELGHREAQGRADFLVAPCNETAVRWIDRWPRWPLPGLVLVGPPASGKSHLVAVWRRRLAGAAAVLDAAALTGRAGDLVSGRHAAVERADALPAAGEEVLLHLFNLVAERRGRLLLTATATPSHWPVALPDLASRLRTLPTARIDAPDDRLIAAVLVKQFADRQIRIGDDVVRYLLPRIERSFAAVRALVGAIDRAALADRKPVTVSLVRQVLASTS